ncbi:MAG TPA: roadblock/LC7 domain-containing protein [Polyangia bacterium]|nr:roadblock/LC7 domain-containing protein [Polyangia bacterium]
MTGGDARALAETVRGSLATLKDVAGITGSFVCAQDGRLVAREIPALFEDAVLSEAGSRLLRVGETFAAHGDDIETAVVRFGDHRLYLKAIGGGMLCIVVAGPVNMPALRMAANLVGRRIAPAVSQVNLEAPPPEAEAATSIRAPAPAAAAARSQGIPGMRRFRGRAVE